ncbi:MAG: hypothetical protein M0Z39_05190, partial [Actinomycetota bacterium]|nr:hypothetical protein [Actinomycetota bacterium]
MQSKKTAKIIARNTLPPASEMSGPLGDSNETQNLTALWLTNEMRMRNHIARRIHDISAVEDMMQDAYV